MAGIGEDIKDVLAELGTPITIYKLDGSIITGEYIDAENYYKHSTDFIRQNVWTCDLSYDSQIADGDIIDMDGRWVVVMNVKDTKFEQEKVINNAFLVETNCLGKFTRQVTTRDTDTLEQTTVWEDVQIDVRGVQVEHIRNPSYEMTEEMKEAAVRELLYVQKFDDIRVGDRWYPDQTDTTEFYKIVNKSSRVYAGLYRLNLEQDTRM